MHLPLPSQIPVMTLANTVLLPQTVMPLYIFETRYRRMLADALAGDRVFAVANRLPQDSLSGETEECHAIATAGLIRMSSLNPDGTSTLILHGSTRVRIEEVIQSRPYCIARVSAQDGDYSPTNPSYVAYRATLMSLIEQLNAMIGEDTHHALTACQSITDAEELTHFAMQTYCPSAALNQRILEATDFRKRMEIAVHFFECQIATIRLKQSQADASSDPEPFEN